MMTSPDLEYLQQRITHFQSTIQPDQAILLSSVHDIHYFSQFEFLVPEEREAFLLVTGEKVFLIISAFSPAPQLPFLDILRGTSPSTLAKHMLEVTQKSGVKKIGFQDQSLFVNEFSALHKALGNTVSLEPLPLRTIWKQRIVKDELELKYLKQAGQIVAKVAAEIEGHFKIGITELDLSETMSQLFKKHGSQGLGFPTIVAFGDHGTSPHHQPGHTALKENTAILIDCGAMINGYRSDLTRTWWFGQKPAEEFVVIEGVVQTAYELALAEINKKSKRLTAKRLDEIVRNFITQEGFGPQFIHTTGHGIGLDIHEPPSLSWSDETVIKPGMVITIEPGIYLDDKFGYRYENTILITNSGAEILTQ